MMWYLVVYLLGLVTGLYVGNERVRDKVNSFFSKKREQIREKKRKDREEDRRNRRD